MPTFNDEGEPIPVKPLKNGYCFDSETSGRHWAIYDRETAEQWVGRPISLFEPNDSDFASDLTGWTSFERGVGRSFGTDPYMKVYGKKLLITQRTGLDV